MTFKRWTAIWNEGLLASLPLRAGAALAGLQGFFALVIWS